MKKERTKNKTAEIGKSALAKDGLLPVNFSIRRINNDIDALLLHKSIPENHKQECRIIIDYLFAMEAKASYRKFQTIRHGLKSRFGGQGINAIERILMTLKRLEKDGYDAPRDLIRKRAYDAALDNSRMQDFLFFVPEKIPFQERRVNP